MPVYPQNYSFRHSIKKLSTTQKYHITSHISPCSFSLPLYGKQHARESMQTFPYPNLKMKCFAARFFFVLLVSFSFPPLLAVAWNRSVCFDFTAHTKTCAVFSRFSKKIKTLMLTSERGFRQMSVC